MTLSETAFSVSARLRLFSPLSSTLLIQCKEGYDRLKVDGKYVVDIGADWGMSPLYFWLRGARHVVAYEADGGRRAALRLLKKRGVPVDVRGAWTGGDYPPGDVLKIDIEGGEKDLDVGMLRLYPQWAVALHRIPEEVRFYSPIPTPYRVDTFHMGEELAACGGAKVHEQEGEEVWVKA